MVALQGITFGKKNKVDCFFGSEEDCKRGRVGLGTLKDIERMRAEGEICTW